MLLGQTNSTADPIDFREQRGVYVLYANYDLVYVGQAGAGEQRLLTRLRNHLRDDLAGRWNRFSWFGVNRVLAAGNLAADADAVHPPIPDVLNHIEAILIHAAEPPLNRQGGRFGETVERYFQVRDERLGPTSEQMLQAIWRATATEE